MLSGGLHLGHLFDPSAELCDSGVDAGLVPAGAAISPAHHPSQEHAAAFRGQAG